MSLILTTIVVLVFFLSFSPSKIIKAVSFESEEQQAPNSVGIAYGSRSLKSHVLGTSIISSDARIAIVDSFLERYNSPMKGHGKNFVESADRFKIPFSLVAAIAQCESNLGKSIPPGSYNAWGYGIYGDNVLKFESWEQGIERVSRGIREDYFNYGLDSPAKIMNKYTPPSKGSWAFCVEHFSEEME